MNNPLGEHSELGRWIFVYDYDSDEMGGGFVTGEFLLRSDGMAFVRMGGSTGTSVQTWRFTTEWSPVRNWELETDVQRAVGELKRRKYGITDKHSNVAVDADEGEPFAYGMEHPTYL
jgi:hypothetical protein